MTKIDELKFDDKNFNKHTEFGMGLLEKSLRENGAGRSILLDKDNNIIAGNGVVEAAGQIGLENVKIVETTGDEIVAVKRTDISLDSKEGRKMALADNATAKADIEWDKENLQTEFTDEELADWGIGDDWEDEETEVVEDEVPEVDEQSEPDSKLGKVYQLGDHRLMCGDSTDAGSVAILMDGQKADMVFTDPPYGMLYNPSLSNTKSSFRKPGRKTWEHKPKGYDRVIGDGEDFKPELINTIFDNYNYCKEIFIWGTDYFAELIPERKAGSWFVWDKRFGVEDSKYKSSEFELCWSKEKHQKQVVRVRWYGALGTESEFDKRRSHPTQKPTLLAKWFLERFSKGGDLITDIYGGSGFTLIACEQLGRKCCMMELDPKYCDVIRKRYWKFKTGSEEGWQNGTKAI